MPNSELQINIKYITVTQNIIPNDPKSIGVGAHAWNNATHYSTKNSCDQLKYQWIRKYVRCG